VALISDGLWRRRFGGDRTIIGRRITLDDDPYVVIGVMPAGFENVLAPGAELWVPLQYDLSQGRAWGHRLGTVARLRPGVALDAATSELQVIGRAVLDRFRPSTCGPEVRFDVVSLQRDVTRGVRPALVAMLGAVALARSGPCPNDVTAARSRPARCAPAPAG
jgi:putative ABC transport system permease protein